MKITGNPIWMQNGAQNAAQQNKNARINPLLAKAVKAMGPKAETKKPDAVSQEMRAKMLRLEKGAEVDPKDKALQQAMEELTRLDEQFYGEMGLQKAQLTGLFIQQEAYTGIVNGTADYDMALRSTYISPEDKERIGMVDFDTYLEANGYQREKKGDFTAADFSNMAVVQDSRGVDIYMSADKVPLYEQWQADKVEKLKQYAAEQLPQIQARIEAAPGRMAAIFASYTLKRAEILDRISKDFGMDMTEYISRGEKVDALMGKMSAADPAEGKKLLDLLNQILAEQQDKVLDMGGTANDVFDGTLKGTPRYPSFQILDTYA